MDSHLERQSQIYPEVLHTVYSHFHKLTLFPFCNRLDLNSKKFLGKQAPDSEQLVNQLKVVLIYGRLSCI